MAQDEVQIKITLDTNEAVKGFAKIEKEAGKAATKTETRFSDSVENVSGGIANLAAKFGPITLAGAAAAKALQETFVKAFDFALLGEQTKAIETQFTSLAFSAGIAADTLKQGVIAATQGLIDDEDALKIATKSVIALGAEAQKIPQVLNLARNASRALGADFKDTFGSLSSFVETGNARVLRQYGIVLDLQKAYADAAKSIGVATSELSEQQQQSIRLELLLGQVSQKFSSTADSVTPLKDAIDRLKVSLGNATEGAAVGFNNSLGPALSRIVDKVGSLVEGKSSLSELALAFTSSSGIIQYLNNATKSASDFSNVGLEELKRTSAESTKSLDELNKKLLEYQKLGLDIKNPLAFQDLKGQVDQAKLQADKSFIELAARSEESVFKAKDSFKPTKEALEADANQKLIIAKREKEQEAELTRFLAAERAKRLQISLQSNALEITEDSTAAQRKKALEESFSLQRQISFSNEQTEIAGLKQKYAQQNLTGSIIEETALNSARKTFSEQRIFIQQQEDLKLKEFRDQAAFDQMSNMQIMATFYSDVLDGVLKKFESFALESSKYFQQVKKGAIDTLAKGTVTAFGQFGQALGRGENATQAFADAIASSISQVAANFGNFFIQTGLGKIALSYGADATGYAMLAAGIALNALAGAVAPKGNSSGGSESANTGGGIASTPSSSTELAQQQDLERPEAGTQVSVVIQGNVLDSDESGSRIVDLINQAFDKKGVVINQGVMA